MAKAQKNSGKNLPQSSSPPSESRVVAIHSADTPELGKREFVFGSPSMRAIYAIATQVAGSDASVLIYGESGTGKELFARLLHTLSDRNARPFVPVNCGVLQGELFADKFFGHEAGAFTGANKAFKGAFESVESGTLFLDEVGEIPPVNQVDFLRVLEERSFRRMGGERDIPFQARIVAATNRPLNRMVQEGSFRADLFYRLNVVPVQLPPLRARKEDIPLLTKHIFAMFCHRYHRQDLTLAPEVMEIFINYPWPGNVRELRNLMERLVLLARESEISAENLPLEMQLAPSRTKNDATDPQTDMDESPDDLLLDTAVRKAEIQAIVRAIRHTGGHKAKAAEILGVSQRTLRYKLAEYKLGILI